MPHYQIEYYNKLWRDWIAFDQEFYQTEEQAQTRINNYKESVPEIQTRIIQTTILDEKPRRPSKRNLGTNVSSEKIR
jgi:hypothetical protein